MNTELVPVAQHGLVPVAHYGLQQLVEKATDPMAAVDRAAVWFARSGLFGCDRVEQGAVLALTCLTEGISPVEFSRTYDIVSGRLRKKAAAAYAQFRQRGGKVVWTQLGDDGKAAAATFTYDGQTLSFSFTIEQAKLAGLVKADSGWIKNPSNMLRARVLSNGIALLAPEIYAGENEDGQSAVTGGPGLLLDAQTGAAVPAPAAPAPVVMVAPAPVKPVTAPKAPPAVKAVAPPVAAPVAPAAAPVAPPASAPLEVVDDVPMNYPATQAQAQPVATAPAPAVAAAPPVVTEELLPDERERPLLAVEWQDKLFAAITPARFAKAIVFCRQHRWLGPDDNLDRLSEKHARQILNKIESFNQKADAIVL